MNLSFEAEGITIPYPHVALVSASIAPAVRSVGNDPAGPVATG
jgi:hypothetical protein